LRDNQSIAGERINSVYDVAVIRDPERIAALDGPLAGLAWHAFEAQPDVMLRVAEAGGRPIRPYCLALTHREEVVGGLTGHLEEIPLTVKLGVKIGFSPRLSSLVVKNGAVAGADDEARARALVAEVVGSLRVGIADAAFFSSVKESSPLWRVLHDVSPLARGLLEPRRVRRIATIPSSPDEFMRTRSANTRRNTKRAWERLRAGVAKPRIELYTEEDRLEELVAMLETVAARTWQRSLGGGFHPSPAEVALYRIAMARGAFRAWVMFSGETPFAYLVGLVHAGGLAGRYMAYDPAFAEYKPGFCLFAHLVGDLCADPGISFYDFGVEDSQFKRSFADDSWVESDAVLFAPRLRPRAVQQTRAAASTIAYAAREASSRSATLARLRVRWRRRVTS
jgi:hypothetical protein